MKAKYINLLHTATIAASAAIEFEGNEVGRKVFISTSGVLGTGGIPTVEYRNNAGDPWVTNVAGATNVHFAAEVTLKGRFNQIKIASSVQDSTVVRVAIVPGPQYGLTGMVDTTTQGS